MKKVLLMTFIILLLAGCTPEKINYDGKVRSVDEAEEMIEDKLEDLNIGKDYEVSIIEETEDDTKKKKKKTTSTSHR